MPRKRKYIEPIPYETTIEKLSHEGRGIARIEGKTTFIHGALADETVIFQYTKKKRDFDEGKVIEVLKASPHRVEPKCQHFSSCGGCSLQHLAEDRQIHEKESFLLDLLERIGHVTPETVLPPLTASPWHYRNKARLSVRQSPKSKQIWLGFRDRFNPRHIIDLAHCPILNARVDAALPQLSQLIHSLCEPESIAQVEVAVGDDAVGLIFRHLTPLTQKSLDLFAVFGEETGFKIYLQPKGLDSIHLIYPPEGDAMLSYQLPEFHITFQFHPTDFTQVNPLINQRMVSQALALLDLSPEDTVLDLFCGLGNFSLPMAQKCTKVIGIEGSEAMVQRAEKNAALNGLSNTVFMAADLDKPDALMAFELQNIDKVLIDPPRTGALEIVKQMHQLRPRLIVYVSCNPATLARDADILVNEHGYRLRSTGVMDMFPQTTHVESIAVFEQLNMVS